VTVSDQEPVAGREGEIANDLGTPFAEVADVERLKEVGRRRKLLASPDVPTARVALRGVTEAVQRSKV
jgi:hypothetical protein